jgi:hypothetical protein
VIFWVFFVALNIFWAVPRFVHALKNISKKNLPYRIGSSQRPDPTRSARNGPTRQPAVAHLSRPSARGRGLHGRPPPPSACAPRLVVRAYKGGAEPSRAPLRALSRPAPPPPCEPAASPPCWSSTEPRVLH